MSYAVVHRLGVVRRLRQGSCQINVEEFLTDVRRVFLLLSSLLGFLGPRSCAAFFDHCEGVFDGRAVCVFLPLSLLGFLGPRRREACFEDRVSRRGGGVGADHGQYTCVRFFDHYLIVVRSSAV